MITRRNALVMLGATAVASCSSGVSTTTIQGIVDWLKANCNFIVTDTNSVAQVVATILPGFNAAAGAAAVVVLNVAQQVEQMICNAISQQVAQASPQAKLGTPGGMVVTVNGVKVPGTYTK